MAEPDREAAIDRLHAAALEEFVRERTRLARELRSGGDRATAAEIARWPKPSPAAWALNHVAREETETIGEWIEAASALRDASATVSGRCSKPRRSTSGSPMSCSWAASPKTSTRPNRSLRKPRRAIYADCQGTAQGQAGINGRDEGRSGGGQARRASRGARGPSGHGLQRVRAPVRGGRSARGDGEVRRRSLG